MNAFHNQEIIEILIYFVVLISLGIPLGRLLGSVLSGEIPIFLAWLKPIEKLLLKCSAVSDPEKEMNWREYLWAIGLFNFFGFVLLFFILKFQHLFPLNPQHFAGLSTPLSFNTAISFVTNTDWQAYSGESQLGYFAQMLGLTVQNFLSAATGIAIVGAIARALKNKEVDKMGNFWTDVVRTTLYILLPLSIIFAVVLIGEGVVQNLSAYTEVTTIEGLKQIIPHGPAASQIAIKQLGTNGGGFFGVNSAHPFENPTPMSNFLELLAILLLPVACVVAFGKISGKRSHARSLLATMFIIFIPILIVALWAEARNNPALFNLPFFEGKEVRFGVGSSTLWGMATTTASNGSASAVYDSFSPLAGMFAIFNILMGEVVFGGVGSGLYGMILYVIIAVFLAGLMVGRSPEYFGKKIEKSEVLLASIGVLLPCFLNLLGTTWALLNSSALAARTNMGPHGLSEIFYAFTSAVGNNGSAFGGLGADTPFFNYALGVCMFFGRFIPIYAIIRICGQLGLKKTAPETLGTFPIKGGSFIFLVAGVILIVGALSFFPILALGPIAEHFMMLKGITF